MCLIKINFVNPAIVHFNKLPMEAVSQTQLDWFYAVVQKFRIRVGSHNISVSLDRELIEIRILWQEVGCARFFVIHNSLIISTICAHCAQPTCLGLLLVHNPVNFASRPIVLFNCFQLCSLGWEPVSGDQYIQLQLSVSSSGFRIESQSIVCQYCFLAASYRCNKWSHQALKLQIKSNRLLKAVTFI